MPSTNLTTLKRVALTAATSLLLVFQSAHAEQPGLSHGRLATPAAAAPKSVELGTRFSSDFTYLGLRLNGRFGTRGSAFLDLGSTRFDGQSPAKTAGAGVYYYWGPVNDQFDVALKGALHHIAGSADTTILGFDVLLSSPDTSRLETHRWQWFAALGLLRPLERSESPDGAATFGLINSTGRGQFHASIDVVDEAITLGYRFNLQ